MVPERASVAASLPDPFVPQMYRVGRLRSELPDTVTLEIAPFAGGRPAFRPGQFNMLYVFGVGEIAVSLSGDSTDETCLLYTSDAADEEDSVDLGGRRIIKKK